VDNGGEGISRMFNKLTRKITGVGKNGYGAALSSLAASTKAGKTTVLNMEISAKRKQMKKLFEKLGERIFDLVRDNTLNLSDDVSAQELIVILKSHDKEIKEIEEYIASFENSEFTENLSHNRLNGIDNNQTEKNTLGARDRNLQNMDTEPVKSPDISAIVSGLKNKDKEVQIEALKRLFKFEGPESIPHMIGALKDKEPEIRRRAALYLGWKRIVSAAPALISVVRDRNPSVRRASFEALGELGTKEAVPVLIKGLDDRDFELRKTAYKSLTQVTNEFFEFKPDDTLSRRFKSIQQWEKWWKEQKHNGR